MIQGGPLYGCFLSPQGDAFVETYDYELGPTPLEWTKVDRTRRAEITTVVLAAKHDSSFASVITQLPQRTAHAIDCPLCHGAGWHLGGSVVCHAYCGLGWYDPAVFDELIK